MCGILGGTTTIPLQSSWIRAALAAMHHRGPDHADFFQEGTVFLGNSRLSVIDLESGNQPFSNADNTVSVVLNGEIYNYLELTADLKRAGHSFRSKSDTEVLLHLYEEYDECMLEKLRGMFAFVIWDSKKGRLFAARDRFGKKPFFYTLPRSGGFVFASELKSLRILCRAIDQHWEISDSAVYEFLSLGAVPPPKTIFKNVQCLSPGHFIVYENNSASIVQYWNPQVAVSSQVTYPQAIEAVRSIVAESVAIRLRSDVPLGVLLSGGVDSSIVAYEAARRIGSSLQSFTVSMGQPKLDESDKAKRIAAQLGIQHTVLPLTIAPSDELVKLIRHLDQPLADSSAIAAFRIAALAAKKVKVILNGDGGDELFLGYRRHQAAFYADQFGFLPRELFTGLVHSLDCLKLSRRSTIGLIVRFLKGFSQQGADRYLTWTMDMMRDADKRPFWLKNACAGTEKYIRNIIGESSSSLEMQRKGDIRINLVATLLYKMDMATMASSLEARSPFLDHVLAEFTFRLPSHYFIRGLQGKRLLRDAYRGRVPDEALDSPKIGFEIPLARWLHGDLKTMMYDTLLNPNAKIADFLDRNFVTDIVKLKSLQKRNFHYIIYSLLVLELWLQDSHVAINEVFS